MSDEELMKRVEKMAAELMSYRMAWGFAKTYLSDENRQAIEETAGIQEEFGGVSEVEDER